jgi:hypothetical protein
MLPLRPEDWRELRSWVTIETVPIVLLLVLLLLCGLIRLALINTLMLAVMALCAVMLAWLVRLFQKAALACSPGQSYGNRRLRDNQRHPQRRATPCLTG